MSSIGEAAHAVLERGRVRNVMIATAESCTGGMVAAALTDIAGSSAVFERGFVTYSNDAKMEMLGVSAETLAARGAVSRETALEMAAGALARSKAGIAVSVTGVAGPGGGSADKPVGLVWFGIAVRGEPPQAEKRLFDPERGRAGIREDATLAALELVGAAVSRYADA